MGNQSLPIGLLRIKVNGTNLTRCEVRVLRLIAQGYTRNQVAERLGKSPETVKAQTKLARARLNAKTTAEAIAIAISLDLI